jgi:alpha-galactosidase
MKSRKYHRPVAAVLLSLLLSPAWAQKFPGLADTPPMGWNSWNKFACDISEKLIRDTADAMVGSGLRDAGYVYINLDDCWQGKRDADGFIQADPVRFPSGIKALADYVHAKGLKLGIYSDAGALTCAKRPGSQGYEYQDALQYARWGIDYVKYDWCHTGEGKAQRNPVEAYTTMRDAIRAAGRPMILSICEWGDNKPWEWAGNIGHLWRTTGDITHCWECEEGHGSWSSLGVLNILDKQGPLRKYAKPGQWNDPDMLEVGLLPSAGENRAHFSMWAMLAAPLIFGADVPSMPAEVKQILGNRDVIAIDQDPLGIQGFAFIRTRGIEYWAKPLVDGAWAIAILNRGDEPKKITHDWRKHDIGDDVSGHKAEFSKTVYSVRDLWAGRAAGSTETPLNVTIPGRDVVMLRLSPRK